MCLYCTVRHGTETAENPENYQMRKRIGYFFQVFSVRGSKKRQISNIKKIPELVVRLPISFLKAMTGNTGMVKEFIDEMHYVIEVKFQNNLS